MKNVILLIVCLTISINGYAQKQKENKWEQVTVYEYGNPLTNCEANFKNLFHNWSKFVTNDQHTKLISYDYIEKLTNQSQIAGYAKLVSSWKSLGARVTSSTGEKGHGDSTIYTREFYLYPETAQQALNNMKAKASPSQKDSVSIRAFYKKLLMKKRADFKNKVQVGDKVYLIKLNIDGKKYDHYAVCRPAGNNIVYDDLFLQIDGEKHRLNKIFSSE